MRPLTQRQRELYDYILHQVDTTGSPPTFDQMAAHLGLRSLGSVGDLVEQLERRGWIRRSEHNRRQSIEVAREGAAAAWEVARPTAENGYEIPPGTRYVARDCLDGLFRHWLQQRQHPLAAG